MTTIPCRTLGCSARATQHCAPMNRCRWFRCNRCQGFGTAQGAWVPGDPTKV